MQNNLQVKKEMQDYVTAKHNIDVFLRTRENEQWKKSKERQDNIRAIIGNIASGSCRFFVLSNCKNI